MKDCGTNKEEDKVMDLLLDAHAAFKKLPVQHPNDIDEWVLGIHLCQGMLMQRVVRRDHPKGYYNQLNKKGK